MPRRSSRVIPQSPSSALRQKKRRALDPSPSDPARETKRQKKPGQQQLSKDDTTTRQQPKNKRRSKYFKKPKSKEISEFESTPEPSESASTYVDSEAAPSVPESNTSRAESAMGEEEVEEYNEKQGAKKRGSRRGKASRGRMQATRQDHEKARPAASATKGKELWREGVRTGLGPGKEVFIKIPKARDPGNTPYREMTLHPNTMLFLKDLKANNQREWLKSRNRQIEYCYDKKFCSILTKMPVVHDADYRTSKRDWDSFVESLTEKIIEKDSTIPELPAKDLVYIWFHLYPIITIAHAADKVSCNIQVFRIYRDVRFSSDQTPYKVCSFLAIPLL
jgi:hypothetical protein